MMIQNLFIWQRRIVALLVLCFFYSLVKAGPSGPLRTGDACFIKMDYKKAIVMYEQASPGAEAQWRIARACICLADVSDKEDKKTLIEKAELASRRCISQDEKNSNGHTWLAASLGNRAMYEGSKAKVRLCNEIKKELDRAIELNPKDDVSYSILGSFYRALGNVSWLEKKLAKAFLGGLPDGGFVEGEQALKHAIAISPTTIRHWHELGMLYDDWGKRDEARIAYAKTQQLEVQVLSDRERQQSCKGKLK